jgi:serine/threonine-protein kinase
MTLSQGQILNNRYRIAKSLGQGGFSAVYRAWDLNLNSPCALKENLETSPEAIRQFAREASMLANLRHPNLPKVIDHFSIPGMGEYLVMEFIEGQDLQELLDQSGRSLPEVQTLPWILQVCDALNYLHSRNPPIIHRDIKPANIRITPEETAVLVDFGIAKIYNPTKRTTQGARATTPGYAPFEQYGQVPTDTRSDVYGLGATLYALLTGQVPIESIIRVTGEPLIPPREINPNISPQVESSILRAMEIMPEKRYQSILEFKTSLFTKQHIPAVPVVTPIELAPQATYIASTSAKAVRAKETGVKLSIWHILIGALITLVVITLGFGALSALGFITFSALGNRTPETATSSTPIALLPSTTTRSIVDMSTPGSIEPLTTSPIPVSTRTLLPTTALQTTTPLSLTNQPIMLDNWTATGLWAEVTNCPFEGVCWTDSPIGNYGNKRETTIVTADSIYIEPIWVSPYLVFWMKLDLEPGYDVANVDMQTQEKPIWWQVSFFKNNIGWSEAHIPLEKYKGQRVLFRFRLFSDDLLNRDGWYLQNIRIEPNYYP